MKKITLICFYVLTAMNFFAQDKETAIPEKKADISPVKFSTDISFTAVYPWAALITIEEAVKIPVLNFDNPLTSRNNLTMKFGLTLSPVTLESEFNVIFTPVAFLELYAGGGIGSGWQLKNFHGFSKNINDGGLSKKEDIKFKDFFFTTKFGGVFQFDIGVFTNSDWAHVVTRIEQSAAYMGAANMTEMDSWTYLDDDGENRNSWTYKASYFLGYQMPIPMQLIGIQVETGKKLYSKPENKHLWGDDMINVTLTPLISFKVTDYFNINLFAQWHTVKNYIYADGSKKSFYERNTINPDKKQDFKFKRAGFSLSFSIKNN